MFLVSELRGVARRVDGLEASLPSKSELAMLRPLRIRQTLSATARPVITDREYAKGYGKPRSELTAHVRDMRVLPGGEVIEEHDIPRAVAALIAVRCPVCHDEAVVGQIALMPREERGRYLIGKLSRIRPVFRLDEVHDLMFAFDVLLDEPRRPDHPTR